MRPGSPASCTCGRPWAPSFALALAAFFALFMYTAAGPMSTETLAIFEFIPAELIHDLGIVVMVLVVAAGLLGIARMARRVGRREGVGWSTVVGGRAALARTGRALWSSVGRESLGQARFRAECEIREGVGGLVPPPLVRPCAWSCGASWASSPRPLSTAAWTSSGSRRPGRPVPIWYPVRLLGTVAGLMLVYGTSVMIIDRVLAARSSVARSAVADWTLLALLWITGVTGFVLELALYLPEPPPWGYWFFLFHVAVAMELVLLAPFMKLAHAVYRPVGLFFVALAREPLAGTGTPDR